MMRTLMFIVWLIPTITLAAPGPLAGYKTYASSVRWNDQRLSRSIDAELAKSGLVKSDTPDLLVVVEMEKESQLSTKEPESRPDDHWFSGDRQGELADSDGGLGASQPDWYQGTPRTKSVKENKKVSISIVDTSSGKLVWKRQARIAPKLLPLDEAGYIRKQVLKLLRQLHQQPRT